MRRGRKPEKDYTNLMNRANDYISQTGLHIIPDIENGVTRYFGTVVVPGIKKKTLRVMVKGGSNAKEIHGVDLWHCFYSEYTEHKDLDLVILIDSKSGNNRIVPIKDFILSCNSVHFGWTYNNEKRNNERNRHFCDIEGAYIDNFEAFFTV